MCIGGRGRLDRNQGRGQGNPCARSTEKPTHGDYRIDRGVLALRQRLLASGLSRQQRCRNGDAESFKRIAHTGAIGPLAARISGDCIGVG